MDSLADMGSRWFCAAAHAAGTSALEMQACGVGNSRYAIGVLTVVGGAVLAILAAWRLGDRGLR